jgi:hypothetical protein
LSARLDPEKLRDIIGDYHRRCAEVITSSGGFVATYLSRGSARPRLGSQMIRGGALSAQKYSVQRRIFLAFGVAAATSRSEKCQQATSKFFMWRSRHLSQSIG